MELKLVRSCVVVGHELDVVYNADSRVWPIKSLIIIYYAIRQPKRTIYNTCDNKFR